jgi:hypothetical protein
MDKSQATRQGALYASMRRESDKLIAQRARLAAALRKTAAALPPFVSVGHVSERPERAEALALLRELGLDA